MTSEAFRGNRPVHVSMAIFAWNEEEAIGSILNSLFQQSLFAELNSRGLNCEVICVSNGCTDRTPEIASEIFEHQRRQHPYSSVFSGRVASIAQRGKVNAWNQYVHSVSAREARFLFMMDADILIHERGTLAQMLRVLEADLRATVSVDRPCKDISFKARTSFRERTSLGASQVTGAAEAQLCGQLYCIRAEVARNIYLPKDLVACEDGFIKTLVCTDSLTGPLNPERIRLAEGAAHTFEAYTSIPAILRNQKRQIMGQTIVHILVDDYLKRLPRSERLELAQFLRLKEVADALWLKRLIAAHLRRTKYFWRLYPSMFRSRFKQLSGLKWSKRVRLMPSALVSSMLVVIACLAAHSALKRGSLDYWPKVKRAGFKPEPGETAVLETSVNQT